ncbi:hypothetical protein Tco_0938703 [Tanacetum coccineum]|uniref:Uncharacterized protein n=1 Tax=Tanacetum coccineum TaxID=301880 RepID=A0ABQ5DJS1_9ASTR
MGRPKLRRDDRLKTNLEELLLSEDMAYDRNSWRTMIMVDEERFLVFPAFRPFVPFAWLLPLFLYLSSLVGALVDVLVCALLLHLCRFDTFGFLAPEAVKLLSRVQRVIHNNVMTPKSTDVIFKRIGFAIQKGLAAQLVARLPSTIIWLFARVVAKLLSRLRGVMVIQVEDSMVASNRDHVVGGLGNEGSSSPHSSLWVAKRPMPEVVMLVFAEMFRTRTVPKNVIDWYGYVDTWLPEEGGVDEFPALPPCSKKCQKIVKSPTPIFNAVLGLPSKTTWATMVKKMGIRGAGNTGKGKEKVQYEGCSSSDGLFRNLHQMASLLVHLSVFEMYLSGDSKKRQKTKPNDKLSMEWKRLCKIKAKSPKMPVRAILKNQQSNRAGHFDELTAMASKQSSSGAALHEMTPTTISSGLVPNPSPSTPFVPPSKSDWDLLFQLLFDELLTPPPSVDHPAPVVIAPIADIVAPRTRCINGLTFLEQ